MKIEDVIFLSIKNTYNENGDAQELYEATNFAWGIAKQKVEDAVEEVQEEATEAVEEVEETTEVDTTVQATEAEEVEEVEAE